MTKRAVADTGPGFAMIRKREKAPRKSVAALKTIRSPLLTCWPVPTEAAWLLRDEPGATQALGNLVRSGSVKLVELDEAALHWIIAFLERYASVGAQMADAAVMYIAEREGIDELRADLYLGPIDQSQLFSHSLALIFRGLRLSLILDPRRMNSVSNQP